MDEDILSSEVVYSDEEIYAEFQDRCQEARLDGGELPAELKEAANALARMLNRNFQRSPLKRNVGPL